MVSVGRIRFNIRRQTPLPHVMWSFGSKGATCRYMLLQKGSVSFQKLDKGKGKGIGKMPFYTMKTYKQ